jgi:glycerol-3-phosphate acyltransferase PlsY
MPPEPPSNGGYMVAAYIVTSVILLGYLLVLWRHASNIRRDPLP